MPPRCWKFSAKVLLSLRVLFDVPHHRKSEHIFGAKNSSVKCWLAVNNTRETQQEKIGCFVTLISRLIKPSYFAIFWSSISPDSSLKGAHFLSCQYRLVLVCVNFWLVGLYVAAVPALIEIWMISSFENETSGDGWLFSLEQSERGKSESTRYCNHHYFPFTQHTTCLGFLAFLQETGT